MARVIDAYASEPHFVDHIAPVMLALPPGQRGDLLVHRSLRERAIARGLEPASVPSDATRPVLVASYGDVKRARAMGRRSIAYLEHGAGQSYAGDPRDQRAAAHGSYAGGGDRGDNGLIMTPGEWPASRWRAAYPGARVEAVGCPKLDALPAREPGPGPVVCVSTHFEATLCDETRSAFPFFREAVESLARAPWMTLIGHSHPRAVDGPPRMRRRIERMGAEYVEDFADVCRRADLYVCDNSSSLFEFAATGRPVVVLNAPWYRRSVSHGGRFWDWATVGVQADRPEDLEGAVRLALEDRPEQRAERERVLSLVYAHRTGAAARAAAALADWAASGQAAGAAA